MNKTLVKYIEYLVFFLVIAVPIFGHLDTLAIRIWDEARLAMNAYEMLNNGDFIVTHFEGEPDMWNTKPPLLIWMQVFFMKTFGVNEIAVRLPSALAAFFTTYGIVYFFKKYLKDFWLGFIIVLVLITSQGFIELHSTRTGDYDALLTLFTTAGGLFFFSYLATKNLKHLYLFFFLMAMAVLTKSITGLVFLPAFFIYALTQKEMLPLLKNKHTYFGLLSFLIIVIGYYLLRETYNDGYIAAVQENELGGRYLNVLENHQSGFWYYYDNIVNYRFSTWHLLVPCGLLLGFFSKDERINKITLFSVLMILSFFLVISTAQTKLEWYDIPMYPFLAIIVGIGVYVVFQYLKNEPFFSEKLRVNILPFLFLFLLGIQPYQEILEKTYKPSEGSGEKELYEMSYYLKNALNGGNNLDNQFLLHEGYYAHLLFYVKRLQDQNTHIELKDWRKVSPSDTVITNQREIIDFIKEHFNYSVIREEGRILTIVINERKGEH